MKEKILSFYTPHKLPMIGVLSIPHSGEWIPDEFRPHLITHSDHLNQDLDYRVNELVDLDKLCDMGVAVVVSHIHRVCVDINRDPKTAVFAWKDNTRGVNLVHTDAGPEFIEKAIGRYHAPYFELLSGIVDEGVRHRKSPLPVIDLHSMPDSPTEYHLKKNPLQKKLRDDFCLSDLNGLSCQKYFLEMVQTKFAETHSVTVNDPYFGGYVTQFLNTFPELNAMQIEINRKLYMDEEHLMMKMEESKVLREVMTRNLMHIFSQSK